MRLLIQRVKNASVSVGGVELSRIGQGLLVLVGVGVEDTDEDMEYLAGKLVRLRIFDDEQGVMNLDVRQVGGEVLVVENSGVPVEDLISIGTIGRTSGRRPKPSRARCTSVSRPAWPSCWAGRCRRGSSAPTCRWRW